MTLLVFGAQWLSVGLVSALVWAVTAKRMGRIRRDGDVSGFIFIILLGPIAGFVAIYDSTIHEELEEGEAERIRAGTASTT